MNDNNADQETVFKYLTELDSTLTPKLVWTGKSFVLLWNELEGDELGSGEISQA